MFTLSNIFVQRHANVLKTGAAALLVSAASLSAWANNSPEPQTLELKVAGLNCALCGESLKNSLKKAAQATDVEPRLECGSIYLEVPSGTKPSEGALTFTLLASGVNFRSLEVSPKTLEEVRRSKAC